MDSVNRRTNQTSTGATRLIMLTNKKVKDLTWEDKQNLVTACYISWIVSDFDKDDYSFLSNIIQGEGFVQLTEKNKDVIESDFNEIFYNGYVSLDPDPTADFKNFEELTVQSLLLSAGFETIIKYL